MNKHYISKLKDYFKDDILWENLKENLKNLKKFKKSKKKKFYIRSKYPHRRSIAKYKSYVTLKRYLTKDCRWYTAKKGCLRFFNFFKINSLEQTDFTNNIFCYYEDI